MGITGRENRELLGGMKSVLQLEWSVVYTGVYIRQKSSNDMFKICVFHSIYILPNKNVS